MRQFDILAKTRFAEAEMISQLHPRVDTGLDGRDAEAVWQAAPPEHYEAVALFIAELACAKHDVKRLNEVYHSLCGHYLWKRFLANPEDADPITVDPRHVYKETTNIKSDMLLVSKRIAQRVQAGRIALAFLDRRHFEQSPEFQERRRRCSVAEMCDYVRCKTVFKNDAIDQAAKSWTASKPVMDLAAAMAWSLGEMIASTLKPPGFDVGCLIENPQKFAVLVERTRLCRSLIKKDPLIPVKLSELME